MTSLIFSCISLLLSISLIFSEATSPLSEKDLLSMPKEFRDKVKVMSIDSDIMYDYDLGALNIVGNLDFEAI